MAKASRLKAQGTRWPFDAATTFAAIAAVFGVLNYVYPSTLLVDWWRKPTLTAQSMTKASNMAVFEVRNNSWPTAHHIEIVIVADGIAKVEVLPKAGATAVSERKNEHLIQFPRLASGEAFRVVLTYTAADPRRWNYMAVDDYILTPFVELFRSDEGAGQTLENLDALF